MTNTSSAKPTVKWSNRVESFCIAVFSILHCGIKMRQFLRSDYRAALANLRESWGVRLRVVEAGQAKENPDSLRFHMAALDEALAACDGAEHLAEGRERAALILLDLENTLRRVSRSDWRLRRMFGKFVDQVEQARQALL
jgi:hypothetical protein